MSKSNAEQLKKTETSVSDQLPELENMVEVFALLIKVDERTKNVDV